uniref:Uncharacterized protein n=1 Tax=Arundo donax TaxID=35708 RepID=A0A0A8YQS9_ARUDO
MVVHIIECRYPQ